MFSLSRQAAAGETHDYPTVAASCDDGARLSEPCLELYAQLPASGGIRAGAGQALQGRRVEEPQAPVLYGDQARLLEAAQHAAHGFSAQAQVVANVAPRAYSCRSASMGCSKEALRAG